MASRRTPSQRNSESRASGSRRQAGSETEKRSRGSSRTYETQQAPTLTVDVVTPARLSNNKTFIDFKNEVEELAKMDYEELSVKVLVKGEIKQVSSDDDWNALRLNTKKIEHVYIDAASATTKQAITKKMRDFNQIISYLDKRNLQDREKLDLIVQSITESSKK
jgi:hypothetical protein